MTGIMAVPTEELSYAAYANKYRKQLLYSIKKWRRDSVLEMIGVDPNNARSQYEYHRRQ